MTEISKIKIDNNDLLIKDAIARNNIESLSTDINNNIESLSTNINNNYLPLTGGSLNGALNLTANDDKTSSVYLRLYSGNSYGFIQARSSSTDYQSNLLVQGGGNLLIGSGESCQSMWSNNIQNAANNTENLFLNSDTNIYINTNVQTTTAVKTWTFNNSGNAVFPGSLTLNTPLTQQNGGTGVSTATANEVFTGPSSGDAAAPSFRTLVAADIPNLNASKITAGTLSIARGGTGAATASANKVFAGPSSGNAVAPSFRALVAADIPDLNASKITAGTLGTTLGGTGGSYSSLTNFMQSALKINKFTIGSSASRSLSIGGSELMVIFWMRATTYGCALISGYNNTVVKVIDAGGSTSPTIVYNTSTDTVTITNNRDSTLAVTVFGGTLHS